MFQRKISKIKGVLRKGFGKFGLNLKKGKIETMGAQWTKLPSKEILVSKLTNILSDNGITKPPVTVMDRQRNIYSSTFPSEIVTCQLADGKKLQLFCKYGSLHNDSFDHKGNVAYEASVYRHVLEPLQISTPRFYGSVRGETKDSTWLVIEFLPGTARLERAEEPKVVIEAARWIGRFHFLNESRLGTIAIPELKKYQKEYFDGWIERTSQIAGDLHYKFPWLSLLCRNAKTRVPDLLATTPTVIHGEYYPMNILVQNGEIYPVDWESSAISFGEIDLATLTDGWGASKDWTPEIFRQCVLEYQRSRWPDDPPAEFDQTFLLARLYIQFRWLGDSKERTRQGSQIDWRFQELRTTGEQLGIL